MHKAAALLTCCAVDLALACPSLWWCALLQDFSGRLTDFGMARAGPDGGETHISTRVMGTMGYLDPTYMETGAHDTCILQA